MSTFHFATKPETFAYRAVRSYAPITAGCSTVRFTVRDLGADHLDRRVEADRRLRRRPIGAAAQDAGEQQQAESDAFHECSPIEVRAHEAGMGNTNKERRPSTESSVTEARSAVSRRLRETAKRTFKTLV